MDDDDLVARVAAGDDTALRELFGRHAPWLAVRLRAVLPADDVEDVLQETFLAAWRGARGYRPQGACGGWLWGIARRQAALLLRRRGPSNRAEQAGAALPADLAAGPGGSDPAETALMRRDGNKILAMAGREPGTRGVASDVRTGPAGSRGGRVARRAAGHGEEPCAPGPAAAARGPSGT